VQVSAQKVYVARAAYQLKQRKPYLLRGWIQRQLCQEQCIVSVHAEIPSYLSQGFTANHMNTILAVPQSQAMPSRITAVANTSAVGDAAIIQRATASSLHILHQLSWASSLPDH
jgi:hypothetical protein